jgi:hypothetical protein
MLTAALFHWMVKLVGELWDLPARGEIVYTAAWFVTAVGMAALGGTSVMDRSRRDAFSREAGEEGG